MDEDTAERWLPVVGYEGYYEVSDQGRVRSLPRQIVRSRSGTYWLPGRIMALFTGDHYSKVRLKRDDGGKTHNVHSLVAAAFLGPVPLGMEVCHNNGHHHDNRLTNLRYDTHSENQRDQVRHGLNAYAVRTHCNYGHEFTPENTILRASQSRNGKESGRRCRVCESDRARRKWQRRKRRQEAA